MIINHGVRGSMPTSGPFTVKYGGSTPCVEILTKNVQIIFDCGSGFSKVKINDTIPTIILLSHFHHDHLQGLPFNPTLYSSKEPILVACAHKSKLETKEIIKQSFSPPFFPFDLLNLTNNVKVVEFKDIVSEFKLYNFSSLFVFHYAIFFALFFAAFFRAPGMHHRASEKNTPCAERGHTITSIQY